MKTFHASSLFLITLNDGAIAHDDEPQIPVRGIQVITEGEHCNTQRGTEVALPADDAADEQQKRCARTLFPPDYSYRYLPDITYTFWKCGWGDIGGCTCGITRIVTAGPDERVLMEDGEFLSAVSCNANCSREPDNKCWVCISSTTGPGWTHYYCKHKADITPFMLGASGNTNIGCFRACNAVEKMPYEFVKIE
eukprot:CAMPEP_0183730332 /NCGR_PEP_ID=MMETSP0737-20130205/32569_1 /TAXON_ID=385413 /ORGANISM="Thalassiosira miniscula, Strain CCMP1093" /LENGTH=193 /DNA_ID=CAMNT_0025962791 /DNA_START=57 /DNA_END=638 /DNA_ORIENTATION=-